MEEIEVPTEHLHEQIQEGAEEKKERWTLYLALSTALMAVLAAVGGLLAGHHANEALIERVKASDAWNFYQSKSLKQEIAVTTERLLHAVAAGRRDTAFAQNDDISRYDKEKAEIKRQAEEAERSSESHLARHVPLSRAVTAFQIAIAVSAIAILTRRKLLWFMGLMLTAVGIVFLLIGSVP